MRFMMLLLDLRGTSWARDGDGGKILAAIDGRDGGTAAPVVAAVTPVSALGEEPDCSLLVWISS